MGCSEKRRTHLVKLNESRSGSKHHNWKKDNDHYTAIHIWVARRKPKPDLCPVCNQKKKLEIHNQSGTYKKDIEDYVWICSKCHQLIDGRIERLVAGNKATPKNPTLKNNLRDPSTGRFIKMEDYG